MKINWKLRFQNKVVLMAIIFQVIGIVYSVCTTFGITPIVDQSAIVSIAESVVGLLVLIGVVVDPTTQGLDDSELAMQYLEPR